MRKWLALLLVCVLLPFAAVAESDLVTYDFVDFTMDLPADIIGEMYEKTDGQVYFVVFPDYNENDVFHTNLNCSWVSGSDDLDKIDANLTAQMILNSSIAQMSAQGVTASNGTVIGAVKEDHNGKPALTIVFSYDLSYVVGDTTQTLTLYAFQAIASHESIGTYTFTVTTDKPDTVEPILNLLNTVVWTK